MCRLGTALLATALGCAGERATQRGGTLDASIAIPARGDAAGAAGRATAASEPPPNAVADAIAVAACARSDATVPGSTCYATRAGDVYCWGAVTSSDRPLKLPGFERAIGVAVGGRQCNTTCAYAADGGVQCSGPGSAAAAALDHVTGMALANSAACALASTESISCWGERLGLDTAALPLQPEPKPLAYETEAAAFALSSDARFGLCAVAGNGSVDCLPRLVVSESEFDFRTGARGSRALVDPALPTRVDGLTGVIALSFSERTLCAVLRGGDVRCWGDDAGVGLLGRGEAQPELDLTHWDTPQPVQALSSVTSVAIGLRHACASTTGGRVSCWGDGTRGQLGETRAASAQPIEVRGVAKAALVVAAGNYSCALRRDGAIQCWGAAESGGPPAASSAPVFIAAE